MRILNFRSGFACNSSSTHSVIFNSDLKDSDTAGSEFGWNEFVAASPGAKKMYLAHVLVHNLRQQIGEELAEFCAKSFFGLDQIEGYVDHQSMIELPYSREHWNQYVLNLEFFKDLVQYVLQDNVAIVGGNDNDDCDSFAGFEQRIGMSYLGRGSVGWYDRSKNRPVIARKDKSGYWTLFNMSNGNKARVSFARESEFLLNKGEVFKAQYPELVDLKITDYCPFNCEACYQGSTVKGKHGNLNMIREVISSLAQNNVFEVAIGGGEPTLHPDFKTICKEMLHVGIIPNFTTRNYSYIAKNPAILDIIGSFAISCDKVLDLSGFLNSIKKLPEDIQEKVKRKVVVQHIVGIAKEEKFRDLMKLARENYLKVVLLGYKTTHRGANVSPCLPSDKSMTWSDVILEMIKGDKIFPYHCGVDTVLAAEFEGKVDSRRITLCEGQFSCYIDAVPEIPRMYASSFGAGDGFEFNPRKDFFETWQKIRPYSPENAYNYGKKSLPVIA
jgi:MoaA/NifB/PqqE/SkfB family radical SAM enzyme